MHRINHISACAALLAGLLRVIAQFIPYTPNSAALELLYGVIDMGFVLAMTGLVMLAAPRIAWPGLVLVLAALVGVAAIVGPDKAAFGIDFYLAGSALFVLSLALAAPWLARLPGLRPAAGAWALGGLAAVASAAGGGGLAFAAAGLLLALGFVLVAPVLWRGVPA
jgi:hypothetical protein